MRAPKRAPLLMDVEWYTRRHPAARRVDVEPIGIRPPDMVGRVVGGGSRGGWTQPGPTPSDLSFRSLLQRRREREREREREPGILKKFPALYTPTRAAKRQVFRGSRDFLSFCIRTHRLYNYYEYIMFFLSVHLCLE